MSKTRNLGNLTDLLTAGSTYVSTTTPPQFDNSTNLATTAALTRALGGLSGATVFNGTNLTLTAAMAGNFIDLQSAFTGTVTLPATTSVPVGTSYTIYNGTIVPITLAAAGTDVIWPTNGSYSSISISSGDTVTITVIQSATSGSWATFAGAGTLKYSNQFGAAFAGTGYQKFPSGVILQWGQTGSNASGVATLTLPVAFPHAFLIGVANYLQAGLGLQSVTATISTNSSATQAIATASSGNTAVNGATVYFIVIGY